MTETDARLSVVLLDALENFAELRESMTVDKYVLLIEALEGDYSGGSGHGCILLPSGPIANAILDFTNDLIRKELTRLGVESDSPRSPQEIEGARHGD